MSLSDLMKNPDAVRALLLKQAKTNLENFKKYAADPNIKRDQSHHIRNYEILVNYYENGGEPPPFNTSRWVRDGAFVHVEGKFPEPYDSIIYTSDDGIYIQLGGHVTASELWPSVSPASP
ncbi:hypothetical protein SEUCBS139899_004397 [Sporothrix eucalyptigena]